MAGQCVPAARDARPERESGYARRPRYHQLALAAALLAPTIAGAQNVPRRPNIVVVLGDDLGFAEMSMFGSEIKTPNLDALAREGVRFTNFYTNASCSPMCATFLSGVDTHLNGLGNMDEWTAPNQQGLPGYEGYLNNRVGTLPQFLKGAGYHTYMTPSGPGRVGVARCARG